jgi:hypothetical protein
MKVTREFEDFVVEYDDSEQVRDRVFNRLMEFLHEHNLYNGEVILQSDSIQLDAPDFLADLIDNVIQFEVKDK